MSEATAPARPGKHIPALDGLRGLAVLLVVLHHATLAVPPDANIAEKLYFGILHGGWMGVDIFFVLSGFLITGILYEAKGSDRFFRNFYGRRVLRIFPVYYFLLATVIIVSLVRHPAKAPLDGAQAWYWLYLQNFKMAQWGNFGPGSLGISWSLAIEEQFYLLWPTVVFFLSRRALIRVCIGTVVTVFILRPVLLQMGVTPLAIYQLTPTRLDGLAIGALLALLLRSEGGRERVASMARPMIAIGAGVCLPLFAWVHGPLWSDPLVVAIGYGAIAICSGGVLAALVTATGQSRLQRIFSDGALRFLGKYSYAIYLFHIVAIKWTRKGLGLNAEPMPTLLGSRILAQVLFYLPALALSVLLALASWHLIEKHCLRLKRHFRSHAAP